MNYTHYEQVTWTYLLYYVGNVSRYSKSTRGDVSRNHNEIANKLDVYESSPAETLDLSVRSLFEARKRRLALVN